MILSPKNIKGSRYDDNLRDGGYTGSMPKKDDITPEERALFRESVKGTIPLGEEHPEPKTPQSFQKDEKDHIKQNVTAARGIDLNSLPLSDHGPLSVGGEEMIEYRGSGISDKDMKRLKKGEFSVQGALDLHGVIADQAREELIRFLTKAQTQQWRCVRIVHGKGKHRGETPILKNLVNAWLRQIPIVIAFCSSAPHEGGAGAVTILLKNIG